MTKKKENAKKMVEIIVKHHKTNIYVRNELNQTAMDIILETQFWNIERMIWIAFYKNNNNSAHAKAHHGYGPCTAFWTI